MQLFGARSFERSPTSEWALNWGDFALHIAFAGCAKTGKGISGLSQRLGLILYDRLDPPCMRRRRGSRKEYSIGVNFVETVTATNTPPSPRSPSCCPVPYDPLIEATNDGDDHYGGMLSSTVKKPPPPPLSFRSFQMGAGDTG